MKKIITAQDIRNAKLCGEKEIIAAKRAIITPEANDVAKSNDIQIIFEGTNKDNFIENTVVDKPGNKNVGSTLEKVILDKVGNVSEEKHSLIKELIQKELKNFNENVPNDEKQINDNGIVLIRGNTVSLDNFDGAPELNIGIKELIGKSEKSSMSVGYMGWENASFSWHLDYEEVDVIIEGELHIITSAGTTVGKPGDVIFIPKGTDVTFSTPTKVNFVYITYPIVNF